jgi:serine/threonine protein kinase
VHKEEIMHRDISPDNILISKKGRVILIDFGAARQEIREKSRSLSVILKAGYAPEEQYRSRGNQGPWTDIYAAAATFHRSITGQAPPEAMDRLAEDDLMPASKLGVSIGNAQEAALIKALAVRSEERYRSVEDFQAALMSTKPPVAVAETLPIKEIIAIPPVIKSSAADIVAIYFIDYERGSIPLASLPIGARVVDPTWIWEFHTGSKKPVVWIVVAKNHYEGLSSHVTLLAEELIGKLSFDNSKRLLCIFSGSNHWGESGKGNATLGLRPWLNSTGTHSNRGFYRSFPANFKRVVLTTTVPNKEWKSGKAYSTSDYIFIPSTTEMGDTDHRSTYPIGTAYPYFRGMENSKRVALLNSETRWYWTRSPVSLSGNRVRVINVTGEFNGNGAYYDYGGVRPAMNLKSETLVSEIRN